jgi:hypothetical protein
MQIDPEARVSTMGQRFYVNARGSFVEAFRLAGMPE